MRRGSKPSKAKIETKRPATPKSRETETSKVRDLEERLAEALKREAEALEKQTATAEILRVISSSPTDLQPVFDTIAQSATRLCGGLFSSVYRFDGTLVHMVAHHNYPSVALELSQRTFPSRPSRELFTTRAILTAAPVYVPDIQRDPDHVARDVMRAAGFQSVLSVPMRRAGTAIGAITVWHADVEGFTDKHVALLETFADQAVIAIENVRLFTETKEALERETATAEILRVISSSPTDVQPVLDTVAESAARLCEAPDVSIFLREADRLRVAARHGSIPSDTALPLTHNTGVGAAVLAGRTVHVADMQAEVDRFSVSVENAQRLGFRTVLNVPLMREGVAIGAISLRRTEANLFSERQAALLETFGDQAVIAIENVRLFTELQEKNRVITEALERQTATSEILGVISNSPTDVQPVFESLVASAARLCGANDLLLLVREGDVLRPAAGVGSFWESLASDFRVPLVRGSVAARSVIDGTTLHFPDLAVVSEAEFSLGRDLQRRFRHRTVLAVPLFREGVALGTIFAMRFEVRPFADQQIALLKTFADQAVIAIENVRLFTELQTSNRELTKALDTQTATTDILRAISSSQTDVQPVFDAILTSAVRLLGAYGGHLTRIMGNRIELVAIKAPNEASEAGIRARFPQALQSESVTAQAIRDRRPRNIVDYEVDSRVSESARVTARLHGYRSWVTVPILRHAEPVGSIMVARREPGGFTDDEIALLQTFADQAVIAIENVRLFTELQEKNRALTEAHTRVTEALERQTATAEVLRVISQTQTEVQPVFDAIADNAIRLFRAWAVAVMRTDRQLLHLIAARGGMPGTEAYLQRQSPWPIQGPLPAARCVADRTLIHISDAQSDPTLDDGLRDLARTRGWRSVLAAPMLRDGQPIGAITVTRAEVGPFSPAEIELLQTFADQAVIAVENARLLSELRARTSELTRSVEELTALGDVSRALSSTLDLETVLTTIVSRAVELSKLDGGVVFEYDDVAEEFVQRVATESGGVLAEARRTTRIRKGEGVLGRTAITLEPVQVPDITVPGAYESRLRQNLVESGIRAILAVPMVRESRLIGCLAVTRNHPGEFPANTIDLLRTFATQSALAIQNARLFREIEEKSRELEAASRHKSEFLANMSHELRTPLNAVIGFSEVLSERMFGDLNEKQDEYLKDIHASGQHLLSLINDILDLSKIEAGRMDLELSDFDLPRAIDNAMTLIRERAARKSITLHTSVDERLGHIQGDERKIRQVLLNLLSNAIKFTPEGGAIEVGAKPIDGSIEVSVSDTGVGIAPGDQEAVFEEFKQIGTADKRVEGTGLGLALSRKFIELHGGKIWVASQVGAGSTFTFTVPVRRGE